MIRFEVPSYDCCTMYNIGDRVIYKGDILVLGPDGFYKELDGTNVGLPVNGVMLNNNHKEVGMPCGGKKTGGKKPPKK